MSSLNNQERQEANVDGSSAPEERKSCPFDEVVVEYERFMSKQRAIDCSKRAAKAHRDFFIWDLDKSVSITPEDEERDDSSLMASEVGNFLFPSSIISMEELVGLVNTFHLSMGHKVLIPRAMDGPAHPPSGYVAISSHHF
ncbi:hypothetical protein ACOSQ2_007555 [Xanthoceras sorbifolium]